MEIEEVIRYVLVSYKIIKGYEEIQISNEFKESEHPRDKDGKFTSSSKGNFTSDEGTKSSPIVVSGNELGNFTDIKEARLKAKEYYKKHLQGKIIHKDGIDIQFSRKGLKETILKSSFEKLNLIPYLEKFIKTGKMSEEVALKHDRKDGMISFRYIKNDFVINGNRQEYLVHIAKNVNGHWFYYLSKFFDMSKKKSIDNSSINIWIV